MGKTKSQKECRFRHRRKRQAFIQAYKHSMGCAICGEDDPIVLEFHHRDPEAKSNRLKHRNGGKRSFSVMSMGRILEEIEKCDVMCANCHRREEYRKSLLNQKRGG